MNQKSKVAGVSSMKNDKIEKFIKEMKEYMRQHNSFESEFIEPILNFLNFVHETFHMMSSVEYNIDDYNIKFEILDDVVRFVITKNLAVIFRTVMTISSGPAITRLIK